MEKYIEKLNELKEHLKEVQCEFKGNKLSKSFEVEYEEDGDQFQFCFRFNYKTERYECDVSVYHASEDNNCENQESHTDESSYRYKNLEDIIEDLKEEYVSFSKHFKEELLK